jgi:Tol biopolymer transport system component
MKRLAFLIAALVLTPPFSARGQDLPPTIRPSAPLNIARYTLHAQADQDAVWSPDGKWTAFVSTRGGNRDIWVKPVTGGDARQLTTDPAYDRYPAWSPDGKLIAFMSERGDHWNLWTIDPFAGPESLGQLSAEADSVNGGQFDWSPDGREIVYEAKNGDGSELRVAVFGSDARRTLETPFLHSNSPSWSPDGKWIVFKSSGENGRTESNLWIIPSTGGPLRRLTEHPSADFSPDWSPNGKWIVYYSARSGIRDLYIAPAAGGTEIHLTDTPGTVEVHPSWSPDSRQISFTWDIPLNALWAMEVTAGEAVTISDNVDIVAGKGASWSPDGDQVAVARFGPEGADLWTVAVDGGTEKALTLQGFLDLSPTNVRWSPDGSTIAFIPKQGEKVCVVPAEGGQVKQVGVGTGTDVAMAWSPDGQQMAIASGSKEEVDIWVVPLKGGSPRLLTEAAGVDTDPDWSPDGSQIIYGSNRPRAGQTEGTRNLWVVPAAGGEATWLAAGHSPHWSPDGTQITCMWQNDICTIPATGGLPTVLLAINYEHASPRWSPDGQRIMYLAQKRAEPDIWIADVGDILDK